MGYYRLIDESNTALPAEISEADYLLQPLLVRVLYRLHDLPEDFCGTGDTDIGFYDDGFAPYRPGDDPGPDTGPIN